MRRHSPSLPSAYAGTQIHAVLRHVSQTTKELIPYVSSPEDLRMLRYGCCFGLALLACQPPAPAPSPAGDPFSTAKPTANQPPANTGSTCGDGEITGSEVCDGSNLRGASCESQGFGPGSLGCEAGCRKYDTSGCGAAPKCGDNHVDNNEQCDGGLGGKTCKDLGFGPGALGCGNDCKYDTSRCGAPLTCNNGKVDAGEACDGGPGTETCETLGFGPGALDCKADCKSFDTTSCGPGTSCGNGKVDAGEACDGAELGGKTCQGLGFGPGTVTCSFNCGFFDTSACAPPPIVCGDGKVEGSEECDVGSAAPTCESVGKAGGVLKCNMAGANKCKWDSSACCVPNCAGRVCGLDPVCGTACGECNDLPQCTGDKCVCGGAGTCTDPCAGQTCSGHGTCSVQAGQAACQCAGGYTAGAGLTCKATPPGGWTCSVDQWSDGVCDCGCGVKDPSCANDTPAACAATHCPANQAPKATQNWLCEATAVNCSTQPAAWLCGASFCGGTCECGCGVLDTGCASGAASACSQDACPAGQHPKDGQNWLCEPDQQGGGWTCDITYKTDADCDCGCGELDTACSSAASSACQWNNCPNGGPINSTQNWLCD